MAFFSGHHRPVARWLAVILLVTGWLVPLTFPHTADDDVLCTSVEQPGEPRTPRIAAAASHHAQSDHCIVCHLIRSFRSLSASGERVAAPLTAADGVNLLPDRTRRAPAFDRLPPRAPPAES